MTLKKHKNLIWYFCVWKEVRDVFFKKIWNEQFKIYS